MSFYFPDGKGGKRLIQIEASIPAADATTKGGVVIDGNGLIMDGDTLNCVVQPETGITYTAGENITISGNTISAADTTYSDATTVKSGLMTAGDKSKLNGIATGAQANVIENVQVNGNALTVSNKTVNIDISGKVDKVNGKGLSTNDFITDEKNKLASITVSGGNVVIDTSNLVLKEEGKGLSTKDYTAADQSKLQNLASITTAGDNVTITNGTIKAASYVLPTASATQKGGIKVNGNGLAMEDGVLKVNEAMGLKISAGALMVDTASNTVRGGVKVNGNGLYMDGDTLKVATAGATVKGGVKVGENLYMSGESLNASLPIAKTDQVGVVKPGSGLQIQSTAGYIGIKYSDAFSITADNALDIKPADTASSSAMSFQDKRALDSLKSNAVLVKENTAIIYAKNANGNDVLYQQNKPKYAVRLVGTNAPSTDSPDNLSGSEIYFDQAYIPYPKAGDLFYNYQEDRAYIYVTKDVLGAEDNTEGNWCPLAPETPEVATTSRNGLMTAADKLKLNKIEENANYYTLPAATSTKLGGIKVNGNGLAMDNGTLKCTVSGGTTYSVATSTADGLMAHEDKSAFDTIKTAVASVKSVVSYDNKEVRLNGATLLGSSVDTTKAVAGSINLNGGAASDGTRCNGGVIYLNGGSLSGSSANGGTISATGAHGGVIDLSPDGSINGSVVFTGTPSLQSGVNGLTTNSIYIPTAAFDSIMSNFATVSAS